MKVAFKGKEVELIGTPPKVGDEMPNFTVLDKNKQNRETKRSDRSGISVGNRSLAFWR